MAPFGYFKGEMTEHILRFRSGKLAAEGPALAFFYLKHNTQIVSVPTSSADGNFAFNETTSNFQAVTIQGQFSWRIVHPRRAAELLNFSVDPRSKRHLTNDPDRLPQRIANAIQMETRGEIQKRSLEETLRQSESIAAKVLAAIREGGLLEPMGAELIQLYFISAKPTPEVAKALEADYRETLLRKADEAIYARRAAAVEEEHKIKERQLNSDIALETQRSGLIGLEGENKLREAEFDGKARETAAQYQSKALEMELAPYRSFDPKALLALGMKEIGENAGKIGNLTITSDILAEILTGAAAGKTP